MSKMWNFIERHLVEDWRNAWRWYSVQWPIMNGAVVMTWTQLPEEMRAAIPITGVAITLMVAGVLARLVKQPKRLGKKKDDDV